jgi:hypothetical protein
MAATNPKHLARPKKKSSRLRYEPLRYGKFPSLAGLPQTSNHRFIAAVTSKSSRLAWTCEKRGVPRGRLEYHRKQRDMVLGFPWVKWKYVGARAV